MNIEDVKATTIEEYLGTLQQSVVEGWKKHLKTSKYSAHKALNEFYDDALEAIDSLIEAYMGVHGKVNFKNNINSDELDTIEYFELLKAFAKTGRDLLGDETELQSELDNVLSIIDSTLYKLRELTESNAPLKVKSLSAYITEQLDDRLADVADSNVWDRVSRIKKYSQYEALRTEYENGHHENEDLFYLVSFLNPKWVQKYNQKHEQV